MSPESGREGSGLENAIYDAPSMSLPSAEHPYTIHMDGKFIVVAYCPSQGETVLLGKCCWITLHDAFFRASQDPAYLRSLEAVDLEQVQLRSADYAKFAAEHRVREACSTAA